MKFCSPFKQVLYKYTEKGKIFPISPLTPVLWKFLGAIFNFFKKIFLVQILFSVWILLFSLVAKIYETQLSSSPVTIKMYKKLPFLKFLFQHIFNLKVNLPFMVCLLMHGECVLPGKGEWLFRKTWIRKLFSKSSLHVRIFFFFHSCFNEFAQQRKLLAVTLKWLVPPQCLCGEELLAKSVQTTFCLFVLVILQTGKIPLHHCSLTNVNSNEKLRKYFSRM